MRHCAYCLKEYGTPVKLCNKCKKRAYCSKACQTADGPVLALGRGTLVGVASTSVVRKALTGILSPSPTKD